MLGALAVGAAEDGFSSDRKVRRRRRSLLADIRVNTPEAVLDVLERLDALASGASGFLGTNRS